MTIGPEPRTKIDETSVLFGTRGVYGKRGGAVANIPVPRSKGRPMNRLLLLAAALAPVCALAASAVPASPKDAEAPAPPVARRIPRETVLHGETLVDPYAWLRDKADPAVRSYLEAENAYADAVTKPLGPLRDTLYAEILGRIKETDLSVPFRKDGYLYYSRTEKGKQYPIQCRKKGTQEAPEEITLDLNELAKGERFLSVGSWATSDDGALLAYATDTTGFRVYTLRFKDLAGGRTLADRIERVTSFAFAADGKTLLYVTEDAAKRPFRLHRHLLGTDPAKDPVVLEEKDERFRLEVRRSRSRSVLFVESSSHTSSEWRFVAADRPDAPLALVAAREADHEYDVDHRGDHFTIRTNRGCRDFRVVTAPVSSPGPDSWKELVPCRDGVSVSRVELFEGHTVFLEREEALQRLRVTDLATGASHRVDFPEPVYSIFQEQNPEFRTTAFRFSYQSFVTPQTVFDYDVVSRERKLLKRTEVPGGYDPSKYVSERRWALAKDGARIPVSLVFRRGLKSDGTAPMLLQGYGSYGSSSPVTFSPARVSLLDRGIVVGIAHVRGGGELGKGWHDQGRMEKKKTTFTDFVTVAETLVMEKVTSKDRLVIEGGSAGGLLMGAVVNLRPDLFAAVISRVPFVDVINTMLDTSLPLTVGEFEEWGNPRIPEQYGWLRAYSPYENLKKGPYPAILVKTSFDDSQVMYWEPAKYVARLRTLKTDPSPLLFKTNMAGGHGGSSGRYDRLKEQAYDTAFILWRLGIAK
jgi:oligopeptidase B